MSKIAVRVLLVGTSLAVLGGCDELTSTTQAVSILTATPDLANAQGLSSDLEVLLPLENLQTNVTGVFVGVTDRDTHEPITRAEVSITWDGSNRVSACEESDGTYSVTSIPAETCGDATLVYASGSSYNTAIVTGSDDFTLEVIAPAPIDPNNVSFDPTLGSTTPQPSSVSMPHHLLGAALEVDWSRDAGAGDRPTFVLVMRIEYNGSTFNANPQPIYDNSPRTPQEMVDLILGQPPTAELIPSTVFSTRGIYFVVLTSTELSTNTDNLALGSGALAGKGTAFAIWVD